jgi:glycosyltransferase involved in cell wall biosynthesis
MHGFLPGKVWGGFMRKSRQSPSVAIDLEKLRHINTGLGRFSLHLAQELLSLAPGRFEPVFFLPDGCERSFPDGGFERIGVAEWKKEWLRRFARPFLQPLLPRSDIALWHTTHQAAKYLPLDSRIPMLLTIHDLNFLHDDAGNVAQLPLSGRHRRKLAAVQRLVDRACAVATDSAYVADEVTAFLDVGERPVHVIPLGLAEPPQASATRPSFLSPGPFFLTVGNCLPHKNFRVLVGMIDAMPEAKLVIAGKKATPYGAWIEQEITARGLESRVFMPGEVSDGDRQWLYENCEAFLFPSLAEGFGFPVLEAMQCGKPVFMSRCTSLPEIAGEHGFFFESFEPQGMADVVRVGLGTRAANVGWAEKVREHTLTFSWAETARRYAALYETLADPPRARRPGHDA